MGDGRTAWWPPTYIEGYTLVGPFLYSRVSYPRCSLKNSMVPQCLIRKRWAAAWGAFEMIVLKMVTRKQVSTKARRQRSDVRAGRWYIIRWVCTSFLDLTSRAGPHCFLGPAPRLGFRFLFPGPWARRTLGRRRLCILTMRSWSGGRRSGARCGSRCCCSRRISGFPQVGKEREFWLLYNLKFLFWFLGVSIFVRMKNQS